jgi:hypothetical protein
VAYERISELRFAIPEGVPPEQLRFFSHSGKELVSQVAPSSGRSPAEIRVTLDAPAIGRLEVEARYALGQEPALTESDETVLSIPLVQSNDVVFSSTRLSCRDAAGRQAVVEGEGWTRQLAPDGLPVWVLAQSRALVPIRVAHSGGPSHRALVSKTLIVTKISVDGTIRSRAQYKTAEGISEMSVAFAPHLEPVAFWWNRRELRVAQAASSRDGTTHYEIVVPDRAAASERLLTIDFIERAASPARLGMGYTLDAPRLSEEQSAAEVRWQVELPFHQHLFTEPAGFFPEYRWRSGRVFWSREPESSAADLEQWIGAGAGPNAAFGSAGGNRYVFGAFGPPPQLAFQAMSQSGIVLIGAGTALILGWILLYWPAARHVLTFLCVAFLVSLLAVWCAAPVQVLVQPAAVGVALAVLAAAIQGFLKRRARPVTVTLSSPSGFTSRPPSHPKSPVVGVGSNEFTAIRPQLDVEHPAEQLSESGNRT